MAWRRSPRVSSVLAWLQARHVLGVRGILIAFLLLGAIYSLSTPIFEALDEVWHFAVIHHITHYGELPVQPEDPAETGLWRQQANQPPLYYLAGVALTFWIDTDAFPSLVAYNPHASGGHPEVEGNKNILLHQPEAERFPFRGTALAIHLLRLFSLALGALTIYGVYRIATMIWPEDQAMPALAAGLVAFNPQFLFIHAGVINDTLAIVLCTWVLEGLTWVLGQRDPLAAARWRTWAGIGLLAGLALLSKLSAGFLLPLIALVLLWLARRERDWPAAFRRLATVGVIAIALTGWWFARNWHLYGDPTGLSRFIPVAGARPGTFGLLDYIQELGGLELSFWAVFGWFSILGDPILYPFFQALDRLALLGLLWSAWRLVRRRIHPDRTQLERISLLAGWFLILIVALYLWTTDVMGTQGRLMFPGAASVAIGLALGIGALAPKPWRTWALGTVVAALACVSLVAPFRYLAPAYRLPETVLDQEVVAERLGLRYDDWGELVGYSVVERFLDPGQDLELTLYWRGLRGITTNYDMYIHLRDPDGAILGQIDTYPGWGMYQTSLWKPGEIVADEYRVPIEAASNLPTLGRIEVGFGLPGAGEPVAAFDPEGREVTPVLGRFKVRAGAGPSPTPPADAPRFGDLVALGGWSLDGQTGGVRIAQPGETLSLTLEWAPLRGPSENYTVFVHLAGDDLRPAAQADGQPQEGRYPTSWWEPGERISDVRTLALPPHLLPGSYQLLVGLYRPADGTRLALGGNEKAAGDAYRLPVTISVE